jgi:exodeoxyribonuclease-3
MRLVSYNILDGGVGRADPLAEVIAAQRPDIVVLVEADDLPVIGRIAGRLGMDFVSGEGKKHGGAILSRFPILESINHSLLREELVDLLLEASVRDPQGQEWTLAAVHLHPRAGEEDEKIREKEVATILEIYEPLRKANKPHVLAGDFNANSPIQEIDPARCKKRTREDFLANGGKIPRRCVAALESAGYVDSLQAVHGAAAGRMGSFTTQSPGQRVDYIFTFGIPAKRITEAKIETDRLAEFASDHFPVVARIDPEMGRP